MAVGSTESGNGRLMPALSVRARLPLSTPVSGEEQRGEASEFKWMHEALARTQQTLRTLQETEELHRLLFEKAPRPRIVCDARTLAILAVNEAGLRQYGFTRNELLTKKITELAGLDCAAEFKTFLQKTRPHRPGTSRTPRVFRHRTSDRGDIEVEVDTSAISVRGRRMIMLIAEDITHRRRADKLLRAHQAAARALAESSTVSEACPRIFQALCEHLGYDWGELWRVDPEQSVLRCTQVWDPGPGRRPDMERATRLIGFTRGEGIPGMVWLRNRPVWITDLSRQSDFRRAAIAAKYGMRTVFAFPIRLNLEVLGVIAMYSRQVQPPDKHLLRLLRDICGQIGQVMGRRRAERRLLEVSEREQQRIGQDLHDGLCQQLAGIAYMASDLHSRLARRELVDAPVAARIAQLSRETAAQARQVARGLNPVKVGTAGLVASLEELAASIRSMFSIDCRFECRHRIAVFSHEAAVHVYRIAQEAIHNAITHGKATQIVVSLGQQSEGIVLRVVDNGRGLTPNGTVNGSGMGLENMNYRARAIGARLRFTDRPEGGTTMDCVFSVPNRRSR